jgi:6-phosphogluconolactonase
MQSQLVDVYVCTGKSAHENPPANAGGIQQYHLSLSDGSLMPNAFVSQPPSVGHLALHPDGRHLYSLHGMREINGQPGGAASAFAVDPGSGTLTFLNLQAVHGLWPSYITIISGGRGLIAVNYGTGNVVLLPIQPDGSLDPASDVVQHTGSSVNPDRQEGPHAHCVLLDPSGQYALVADLGLDRIVIYQPVGLKLCARNSLAVKPGSGPRHLAYHPNGRYLYSTNELDSTVTVFTGEIAQGRLHAIQRISTLPAGFGDRNSPAHLQFAPSGNRLYVSNRGHDSIAVFAVDAESGHLRLQSHVSTRGSSPRHFAIDPTGQFLLVGNEKSSSLVVFRIDAATGDPSLLHIIDIPNPVFVLCRLHG